MGFWLLELREKTDVIINISLSDVHNYWHTILWDVAENVTSVYTQIQNDLAITKTSQYEVGMLQLTEWQKNQFQKLLITLNRKFILIILLN